ncbi:potassium transporter Kup [Pseudaquabacterium rugosum]|uniref:Probable potassium transport system protein Kup n=1 Tax=Pseudaquabacterium rugosum TaxID=2984194 RepID=A0ABU9BED5_9BURK
MVSSPAPQSAATSAAGLVPAGAAANTHGSRRQGLAALTLGAIGVVYGDIGTSPLYTVKTVFRPESGLTLTPEHLIGAISTILWALMLVVTLKYVVLILRADNRGEGGGLALTALAAAAVTGRPRLRALLLLLGVFGATLFYGDSVITPAVSVLGAMEGLQVISPDLAPWVVPGSVTVLLGLFAVQRLGTAVVGRFFGPVIVLWFVVLGAVGVHHIVQQPAILAALNPWHAVQFMTERGPQLLLTVGAVVLALTGAEALYADMGHFGRKPIRLAWSGLVLPSLALNYMGQGALLMGDPAALENPFFRLFPEAGLLPAVVLATLAAIIASQAVISGAYSMTRQAIQLGYLPRMAIRHTSAAEAGQIYVPAVNAALLLAVVAAVLHFGSSEALAAAYGIAVTLTMLITTLLTAVVARQCWGLPWAVVLPGAAAFLALDALLVAGCAVKLLDGGWFPLALGLLLFTVMLTWAAGRRRLLQVQQRDGLPLRPFVDDLVTDGLHRPTRTAVYPVADPHTVPQALLHNLKHNQVLHTTNVIVTVHFAEQPWVAPADRVLVQALGRGFWRVTLRFGFMETPDVPQALAGCAAYGLPVPAFETSYFLSRETVVPGARDHTLTPQTSDGLGRWRGALFATLSRNAGRVVEHFRLPDNAVVELGTRVQV